MEQYIPKSALVAEIKKLFEKAGNSLGEYRNGAEHTLISINDFLDTLETKDIDLEKEYKEYVEEDPVYNKLVNGIVGKAIAKHFFELGMSVSNEAQKRENI